MKFNLRYFRYIIFFLSFFIFISAAQVFIQNFNINKTIKEIKNTQNSLSWETIWMKKYYSNFLKSDYASYFLKHKQWITLDDEVYVKIKDFNKLEDNEKKIDRTDEKIYNKSTQKSWDTFFEKLKNLFINN